MMKRKDGEKEDGERVMEMEKSRLRESSGFCFALGKFTA
jgi:hypothetical protein